MNVNVNGAEVINQFYAPVKSFSKIVFRTGEVFRTPTPDTPSVQDFDLENAGISLDEASYYI